MHIQTSVPVEAHAVKWYPKVPIGSVAFNYQGIVTLSTFYVSVLFFNFEF